MLKFSKGLIIPLSTASLSYYYFRIVLFSNKYYSFMKNILYEVDGLFMPGRMRAKCFEVKSVHDSLVELSSSKIPTYSSTNQTFLSRNLLLGSLHTLLCIVLLHEHCWLLLLLLLLFELFSFCCCFCCCLSNGWLFLFQWLVVVAGGVSWSHGWFFFVVVIIVDFSHIRLFFVGFWLLLLLSWLVVVVALMVGCCFYHCSWFMMSQQGWPRPCCRHPCFHPCCRHPCFRRLHPCFRRLHPCFLRLHPCFRCLHGRAKPTGAVIVVFMVVGCCEQK